MTRKLLAFFLACLVVSILFNTLSYSSVPSDPPTKLVIRGSDTLDVDQAKVAIEALHIPGARVSKEIATRQDGASTFIWQTIAMTFLYALIGGLILFFYRHFYRWIPNTPDP